MSISQACPVVVQTRSYNSNFSFRLDLTIELVKILSGTPRNMCGITKMIEIGKGYLQDERW